MNTTEKISIDVDNRARIQVSSNPKSTSTIARRIFKFLHENPNISVKWIKSHAGHEGNEKADQMAKEAAKHGQQYQEIKLPKLFLKATLKRRLMEKWQVEWQDGDTGRKVEKILPKMSLQSVQRSSLDMDHFQPSGIDLDWLQTPCAAVVKRAPHFTTPQNPQQHPRGI
ncbi:hypothetical protein AVEN_242165-1 [Araneus ventricosus]|uniref:RNase H type-1 domain-containing protein n=1 Tax=Araneus ventricosus TaxID=182803 RepID=A0A4Y2DE86_ARAVE|nr:hypothetical protein AVEN_242165-1 [Araneus ventricosus]